jgi:hypothetical protein
VPDVLQDGSACCSAGRDNKNFDMLKNPDRRVYLAIVLLSAIMMLIVLNLPFKAKPFGDITFHEEAKNMALYLKGHLPEEKVVITKAPGPVIFYTLPYLLAPSDATDNQLWGYGAAFTGLIIMFSMFLIFKTAKAFFCKEIGVLSLVLFFIFPIHYYYSLGIIAEAPAFFSFAVALYGWSKAYFNPQGKAGWMYIIAGFLFLILNRPNTMLLFGIVTIVLAYAWFRNRNFFAFYAKPLMLSFAVIGILGFGTLQTAKYITNKSGSDSQDNLLYFVAHLGRFQFREEPADFRFWDDSQRADSKDYQNWKKSGSELGTIMAKTGKSYKEVYKQFLIDDAIEHPWLFTRQFFVKCFFGNVYLINSIKPENFKLGPIKGPAGFAFLISVINIVNVLIIVGIFIFLFTEKSLLRFWPFWGIIAALLLFHGLTYMEPRYLFPSKAALYVLSAAGLYRVARIRFLVDKMTLLLYPTTES